MPQYRKKGCVSPPPRPSVVRKREQSEHATCTNIMGFPATLDFMAEKHIIQPEGSYCIENLISLLGKSTLDEQFRVRDPAGPSQAVKLDDSLLHFGVVAPLGVVDAPPAHDDDGAVGSARAQFPDQLSSGLAAPAQHQGDQI